MGIREGVVIVGGWGWGVGEREYEKECDVSGG